MTNERDDAGDGADAGADVRPQLADGTPMWRGWQEECIAMRDLFAEAATKTGNPPLCGTCARVFDRAKLRGVDVRTELFRFCAACRPGVERKLAQRGAP